jgi:hypothetical protein
MSRGFLAALTAAGVAFAPCALVLVDFAKAEPTTVHGSHHNSSSYRMGGGGGHRHSARVIRGSKSNQSERMGGGGGHNPAKAINLDSRPGSNY